MAGIDRLTVTLCWPNAQTTATLDRAAVVRMARALLDRAQDSRVAAIVLSVTGEGITLNIGEKGEGG
jgi:hypothetical protein